MDCDFIDRYDLFEELTSMFGNEVGIQESQKSGCIYCHLHSQDAERAKEFNSYLKKNYASNYLCTFVDFMKMRVTVLSIYPNSQVRHLFEMFEDSTGSNVDEKDSSLRCTYFVKY